MEEKDHAANSFLKSFVTKQVDKEASASEIVNKLKVVGDTPGRLFMLDREMDGRVFTMPAALTRG